MQSADIIFTKVDEAPQLASASLLPIVKSFLAKAGITIDTMDISLAGRVLAAFPEALGERARPDDLAELGKIVTTPKALVIKLPNISASVPQLTATISELQSQGFPVPDYPEAPATDEEKETRRRYDAIKGSAVNPVLREGNSDRRAARAVKNFAKKNPHRMGAWSSDSKTHVATMTGGDFFSNEVSRTLTADQAGKATIEFLGQDGSTQTLKDGVEYFADQIVDATKMSVAALRDFARAEIAAAKEQGVLFSLHMKATMMKVSDPIIFGHVMAVFFEDVFVKHADTFAEIGVNQNNGLGELLGRLDGLPADKAAEIRGDIDATLAAKAPLYMVNSDKGITNFHVPSDVIIDASMPPVLRAGGKAWGPDGGEHDVKCMIPDGTYAPIFAEAIDEMKENGALDPSTIGAVQNVGLMAKKAQEYGSHPTTFEAPGNGVIRIVAANGDVLHEMAVETGDIWRSANVRDESVRDWIRLAVRRQKATGAHSVFWLDENRAHDAQLIAKVNETLAADGVDASLFKILSPKLATRFTLERIRAGEDVISITGNVLRDYLTDLYPILEIGTSAKMLSIVPLMQGGAMFETGAGGSAPKHVQQLVEEGHLRWDSLGEFCALGEALAFLAERDGSAVAKTLATAVEDATEAVLLEGKSPGRKVGQTDNRDSHYFFALYWAEAMAKQTDDAAMAEAFAPVAEALKSNQDAILTELGARQGSAEDLGGYFKTDAGKTNAVMRPSATLNQIIG